MIIGNDSETQKRTTKSIFRCVCENACEERIYVLVVG